MNEILIKKVGVILLKITENTSFLGRGLGERKEED